MERKEYTKLPKKELLALIKLAQAGDREAMSRLVEQFHHLLLKFARQRAPHRSYEDDFYQLAAIYFMRSVETFDLRLGDEFLTWVYARVPWQLFQHRNDYGSIIHIPNGAWLKGIRPPKFSGITIEAEMRHVFEEQYDEQIDCAEQRRLLWDAIESLPSRLRMVLRWRLDGKILQEIAELMDLTREAVRQIELRARAMVAKRVAQLRRGANLRRLAV